MARFDWLSNFQVCRRPEVTDSQALSRTHGKACFWGSQSWGPNEGPPGLLQALVAANDRYSLLLQAPLVKRGEGKLSVEVPPNRKIAVWLC